MNEINATSANHLLSRRVFFGVLFLFITILVLLLIRPYINVILFSLTIVLLLMPVYRHIYGWKRVQNFRASRGLATALTIIAFILIVAVPVGILIVLTFSQVKILSADIDLTEFELKEFLDDLATKIGELPVMNSIAFDHRALVETVTNALDQLIRIVVNLILKIGSSFPNLLISTFLFLGFLVTLLPKAESLRKRERILIPLENAIVEAYATKISLMTRSMFLGIFVLSFIQGITMGIFYIVAGIPYAFFWTTLSVAFSIIPLVGISFIVLPMSIILIANGDVTSAVIVLIGFYGFANWIDTLLRPRLVPKGAYLHPMLLILSVFGGMALAGLLGVVYGPVIMILFVTTLDLYRSYFLGLDSPEELDSKRVSAAEQVAIDS